MRPARELAQNGLFIKICGITTEEDALLAIALGADALGFVFAPGSKRLVSVSQVADIVRRLPPEVTTLGVFRNELPERVIEIVQKAGLSGAQLSGHESAAQCAQIAGAVGYTIQAFPAGDRTIDRAKNYPVEVVMIDNPTPGSGEVFDWSSIEVPDGKKLLLAENVVDAVTQIQPWGIDVSTGVEAGPGRKDPRKLRAFIANARKAAVGISVYNVDPDSGINSERSQSAASFQNNPNAPYDWQEEL
jgi:phosphoribosylanthranilate isomerase